MTPAPPRWLQGFSVQIGTQGLFDAGMVKQSAGPLTVTLLAGEQARGF